jgi:Leucine-rich repeat (LRR) protein
MADAAQKLLNKPRQRAARPAPGQILRLTAEDIVEATGQQDLDEIESIEIIFGVFHELAPVEGCTKLRSLTVMNSSMQRITGLQPIAPTLERLCLCDQGLTRMEGLGALPNLRELLLHENAITRMEGLGGCPRLQKLWLASNKIPRVEGLHGCADLRELWLQDNKISALGGLGGAGLPSLQVLALADNRIADFGELGSLAALPALRDLSLADEHFGSNPVARAEGYRHFALAALRQVARLDGVEVSARGRQEAADAYTAQVLQFSDRVAAVQRENQRELQAIETRERRSERHADVMKRELLSAFADLEKLVLEGRRGMATEHTRQKKMRDENLRVLEEALGSLQRLHVAELDAQVGRQRRRVREEASLYLKKVKTY